MALPKVLILNQPFDNIKGGGITLSNLFANWDSEKLAVACSGYLLGNHTNSNLCNNYYQLGHEERRWIFPFSIFGRKYPSGRIRLTDSTKEKIVTSDSKSSTRVNFVLNYLYPVLDYFGLNNIMARTNLSKKFCDWLADFSPDIIYAQCTTLEEILFTVQVQRHLNKPFVFHMMDDWPSLIGESGFMKNYWKKKVDKEFRHLIAGTDVPLAISDYMAQEYKKRYGKSFGTFHNPVDLNFWKGGQRNEYQLGQNPTILYAGRTGLGIDESLLSIAKAISKVNTTLGMNCEFIIQAEDAPEWISNYSFVSHRGFVPYKELPKVFGKADFLMLPYDFGDRSISFFKLSMPTKAAEYMVSGTPIIIYAPEDTALVKYAKSHHWAQTITKNDIDLLTRSIIDLIKDENRRKKIALNAIDIAENNHSISKVSKQFQQVLVSAISQKDAHEQ